LSKSQVKILQPVSLADGVHSSSTSQTTPLSSSIVVDSLASIGRDLYGLCAEAESKSATSECELVRSAVLKAKKFVSLAVTNSCQEYHYASFKLLRSASKALTECIAQIEQLNNVSVAVVVDNKVTKSLVDHVNRINHVAEQISRDYLLNPAKEAGSRRVETTTTTTTSPTPTDAATAELNIVNGWILSEFNLVSNDFNNELALISGELFDLNYNYQLDKVLSKSCLLMKLRHPSNDGDEMNRSLQFVLKV
jgi:hypothetical protein